MSDESENRLVLSPEVAREVLDHALDDAPLECCGVLLGPAAGRATSALRARNVHDRARTRYRIDPKRLLQAVETAEAEDLEVVGFYHSHPRGHAAFSQEDRARGAWEGTAYLLVSLQPLAYVGGRWGGSEFEPLEVTVATEEA